jgi:hypothetical protein
MRALWALVAVGVLALATLFVVLGMTLMPSGAEAASRGTYMPWLLTWVILVIATLTALVLAGFLFTVSRGRR